MHIETRAPVGADAGHSAGPSPAHHDHGHAHHHAARQPSHRHAPAAPAGRATVSWREAGVATLHCLTGCAIGEVSGLVIGTAYGLSNGATIALAVTLAFVFGFALTMVPVVRSGLSFAAALKVAFAADAVSISIMEIVDNAIMLAIPGAMDAALGDVLFWSSMTGALIVAGLAAWPVNRWLIARGKGHAVVHAFHHHH